MKFRLNLHKNSEGMESIVTQMVILIILVITGYFCAIKGYMGGQFDKTLSALIINVTCPCLIVGSTMGESLPDSSLILPILGTGFLTYLYLFTVSSLLPALFVKNKQEKGYYKFMLMFANVGFMGYPIVSSLFGEEAVFYACLLNIPNTLTIFAIGTIFILGDEGQNKRFNHKILFCPAMMACYISIAIVTLHIENIPNVISTPFKLIGNITTPGAMLLIGSSMAHLEKKKILGSFPIYAMSFMRLIIIPAGCFLLCHALGIDKTINQINTIIIGMPVATFGTMFCLNYNKDESLMVQGTVVSTMLSAFSIPILSLLIG